MIATASMTMGLIALIAPYPRWILELPVAWCNWLLFSPYFQVMTALEHIGLTFLAALATLRRPLLSRRLGWVALVAAVWPLAILSVHTAALLCVIEAHPDIPMVSDPREFFLQGLPHRYHDSFRQFGFLAASFLVARLAGCRLVGEESDSSRNSGVPRQSSPCHPQDSATVAPEPRNER